MSAGSGAEGTRAQTPMRAIVLADGDAVTAADLDVAWPGWSDGVGLVVAADGGARLAPGLGLRIDRWVGDGDSISAPELDALAAAGVAIERSPAAKDESDTELAVLAAVGGGARDVTVVGGLGGPRVDHALANLALLAHPALAGRSARLLDARTRVSLLDGPGAARLTGRVGDLVSLLPFGGDVEGVTTEDLAYPLRDEPLLAGVPRGLSNVRAAPAARVVLRRGRLLIVETAATR